ncbi:uncharacterized protein LOC117487832 [Trematomus bernacchii]|uniref:uncharacterized protein LOC117487832 n=1 Tax=Trematomus bernacchii TaxID=40690 RepID=UPI00146AE502|nr:uncharacterized protein LOC117487832 [Trematomus bernacchii]
MDHQKLVPHQDQEGQQLLEVQQQQAIQQLLEVQQQQAIQQFLEVQQQQAIQQFLEVQQQQAIQQLLEVQQQQAIQQLLEVQQQQAIQQFLEVQQQQAIQQLLEVQQQQCDLIFGERFQQTFIDTVVIEFRPITGKVQVEVGLEFNTTTDQIPTADVVVDTIREAVNKPNNTFNLPLDPNSITVIPPVVPTTTTGPMTTGFTLTSSPVVVLTATLEKPFVKELKNRSSEQYRELERQVVTTCDLIFRERFWLIFFRTFVIAFRPIDGNVEIEVGLEFNTTTDQIPTADVVVDTIREAVNKPNNTFNLPLDPNSITVIPPVVPTTTTGPMTTGFTLTSSPVVVLTATLERPFVKELENRSSEQYRELERQVVTTCDLIFRERFWLIFFRTFVIAFRPIDGNVEIEVGLEFNTTTDQIPTADVVVDTIREAVNKPNNTFNLPLDPNSITVIPPVVPTTTTGPMTTGFTLTSSPVVVLTATLERPFVKELENRSSEQYRELERQVVTTCDLIFRERFWLIFFRTFVIAFRPIDGNVEIEVGLEFNTTTDQIPTADVVVDTIREAVNKPNNTFNLPLDPNSITVIPPVVPTTTTGPMTTGFTLTSSPVVVLTATLERPFVKELENRSSEQYRELERQVVTTCDLIFRERFWLIFFRTFVIAFRPIDGNVEIEVGLEFNTTTDQIPTADVVVDTIREAVNKPNNTFNLPLDPNSITVIPPVVPTTTTGPMTTGFTLTSSPVVVLTATLERPFVKELENRSSEQYRELERQVVTTCDLIFRERFWLIFFRTFVIAFRPIDGNVEIEVGLEFNTTTDQIPTADVVVDTIREAVNKPNNTFNLPLDPNSITVIPPVVPTTTTGPMTTGFTLTSSPVVVLTATLERPFVKELENRSSEQYRELERQVVTTCDLIFRERFWLIFFRTFVIAFRPIDGKVEIEVGLEFNTTTDQIPTADVVVDTIREAVNKPNNTFNLPLDPNSITVIPPVVPTTTTGPMTTGFTLTSSPVVVLTATLERPFVKELENRSSEQYRELERQVVTTCDLIFRERFWLIFFRTFVIAFRPIDGNVEIEVGLEFNTTTDQIPTADVVVDTIREAVNKPNNTFNLPLDPNSITVIPPVVPTTTTGPMTTGFTLTSSPVVVLTATLERPFVKELENRSSEQYRELERQVVTTCDLIFRERFWLIFFRTFVIAFRPIDGKVEIEVGLEFNTTTDQIPTADVVVDTIREAVNKPNNTFNLPLDPNSITVIPPVVPTTTTGPMTTGFTLTSSPVVVLTATLERPFVKELENRSSEQYRELERQVVTTCDLIFRERFWLIFFRTFVIAFRPIDGKVEIEVGLEFNTTTDQIPTADVVVDTIREAVNKPNNTFNLPLDPNSITVIPPVVPTTTTGPMTTGFTLTSSPVVVLTATLERPFVKELENRSSEQYRELERQVVTTCDLIFRERFWLIFFRTFVIAFRPIDGKVEIEVGLEFNTTTDQIPTADVVVDTIREAVNKPNNTFNLPLDPNSITVIPPVVPTTTTGPMTTGFTLTSSPVVVLTATLERPFVKELENRSSEQYRELERQVVTTCDLIFRERFWLIFFRTFVIAFRPIDGKVEIEVGLEFNTTTDQIPTADVVVDTIREAVNKPNNTFNLPLDPNSITVIPPVVPTTTTGPMTTGFTLTSSPVVVLTATLERPFVKELENRSSEQYRELERQVVTTCDLIFRERFWLIFFRTFVIAFRPIDGNVEIEVGLEFNTTTDQIPTADVVVDTIREAVNKPNNTFNLPLDPNSITVIPPVVPTTTTGPMTTGFTLTSSPVVVLTATLERPLVKELENRSSEQYRELERQVVTTCDLIFRERFWLIFFRTFVIAFRPIDGNVEIEVGLEFNTTTDQIPTADVVVDTIREAVNKPNNTFNLPLDPNSITVIPPVVPTTTTGPMTTGFTLTSSPVVVLTATLERPFVKELENRSSEQYRELERQVVTTCDLIFRERFWLIFFRTFVIAFRPIDGNVEIEVGLEFNTTTDQIPTADVVVDTIREAVNKPNNTFNLPLDPNSITVIPPVVPTTTTGPMTTGFTLTSSPVVVLTATLERPFVKELENRSSEQYRELERQVVTTCDLIFRERFWLIFFRTFVIEFRPIDGNVEIEVGLEFNTTTDQIPTADVVVDTIREAVNKPNNTFNLPLDPNSITVIPPVVPTTTTGPMTTGFTLTSSPVVVLTATLERPFVKELENRSSEQYRELERQVVTTCDLIFRERFWLIFFRTFVIAFRPIDGNVEIEVGLEFNTTTDQIPTADVVVDTIREAVNKPNNTFNLPLDPNSITVIPPVVPTTTTGPMTTGFTLTSSPVVVLTATLERPFVKELENRSSEQYRELERQVVTTCDLIFRERFWLIFFRTFVIAFRPIDGKVEIEVGLEFNTTTDQIPTADVVVDTIREAVNKPNNTFNLPLDPNSITVIPPVVPTTTTGPMTTGFTLTSSPVVVLTATLERPFVKELENRSSEQYRELERQVVTTCDLIFRERFWLIFFRTFVIAFRPIDGKVEIEVGLEFNTTTDQIPTADVVVDTIREAVNKPNNTFQPAS